jgi:hypothetical protein
VDRPDVGECAVNVPDSACGTAERSAQRLITVLGQRIRVSVRAGAGAPLVLCHGGHVYIQDFPECGEVHPTQKWDDYWWPNHVATEKLCCQRAT